jgi:hypothetical protein
VTGVQTCALPISGVFALVGVMLGARIVMKATEQRSKISKVKTEINT